MEEVIIRYIDLPYGVKGFVRVDNESDYNVYINTRYASNTQAETLLHELEHIECEDFYNDLSISEIENFE